MSEQIKTIDIKTDGGTQPRAILDADTVAESNADVEPDVTAALNNLKQVMLDAIKAFGS